MTAPRTDTERLDWLEENKGNLFTGTANPKRYPDCRHPAWYGDDSRTGKGETVRAAIDAVMDAERAP